MSTCVVEECEKRRYRRSRLCAMHLSRVHRHGDLSHDRPRTTFEKSVVRFWSRVEVTDTCWLWTGAKTKAGYGYFRTRAREFKGRHAHRFAWLLYGREEIPEGYHLDHLCRVRHCVNPDHLEPVTPQVNTLRGIGPSAINSRKPRCPRCGGEYVIAKRGELKPGRYCQPCHSERRRQRKAARKGLAA